MNLINNLKHTKPYQNLRKKLIDSFIKQIKPKIYAFNGKFSIDKKSFFFRALKSDDREIIEYYYKKSIMPIDRKHFHIDPHKDLDNPIKVRFGVFHKDKLVAIGGIRITGVKKVELGVSVSKEFRRKGISTTIMRQMEKFCKKNSLKFYIMVHVNNNIAVSVFQKQGYKVTKKLLNVVRMEK